MPFFLVSHKSLIEADSERAAAEATLLALQDASTVTFTVAIDQDTIKQVVLEARPSGRALEAPQEAGATKDQDGGSAGGQTASFPSAPAQVRPSTPSSSPTASGYAGLLFVVGLLLGVALASS